MKAVVNTDKIDELSRDIGEENLPMLFSIFIGELVDYAEALLYPSNLKMLGSARINWCSVKTPI
jgi:two-component system phosphorelay protein LuxU